MRFILAFLVIFYSFTPIATSTSTAPLHSLVGDWDGLYCGWYDDNTSTATYNYNFGADNKMFTYLQYYDYSPGSRCKVKSFTATQCVGTYEITSTTQDGDKSTYEIKAQYTHLSYPLYFRVILTSAEDMKVCRTQSDESCRGHKKKM